MRIQNLSHALSKQLQSQNNSTQISRLGSFNHLLIYGNHEGSIQFNVDVLAQAAKSKGFDVHNVSTLKDVDTGSEPGLFGGSTKPKFTIARGITGRDFDAILAMLASLEEGHCVAFVGGNLGSKIKLVKHFQDEPTLGAVGCYDVSLDLIRGTLQSELDKRGLKLSNEQKDLLIETYAGSPVSLFTDMEKIALFTEGDDSLTNEDLLALVNGASQLNVDQILEGFLKRNKQQILENAPQDLLEAEPYLVLRALSRQVMQFCEFMAHVKHTNNPSLAIQKLTVPVFYQTKSLFQNSAPVWTEKLAAMALRHLLDLEFRFKSGALSTSQFQASLCLFAK